MSTTNGPPWLARMTAIMGLAEVPGDGDNPAILEMARVCGGTIAQTYIHDSIAWCALALNYALIAEGYSGNDSLWALDFAKYGAKLSGPAVGAIATKTRDGGGHVFLVVGRTADNQIVGRGGNQSDMVCDELFDPATISGYNWPGGYTKPSAGFEYLPIVEPQPKTKKAISLPAPSMRTDTSDFTVSFSSLVPGGYFCSTPFDKSIPVSIRCNNPGALNIASWIKEAPGYVGDKATTTGNSTVIFSTPEYGVAAWWTLMSKYRAAKATTVEGIIERYGGGQDYSEYINAIVRATNLSRFAEIKLTGDDATLLRFARGMFNHEAGRTSPLSDAQILKGFDIARNKPTDISKTGAAAATAVVVAGAATAQQIYAGGARISLVVAIALTTLAVAASAYLMIHRNQ